MHFMVDRFRRSLEISSCVELEVNDALAFWWIPLYTWRVDPPMRVTGRSMHEDTRVVRVAIACVRELVDVARGCCTSYCFTGDHIRLCKYVCHRSFQGRRGLLSNLVQVFLKQIRV